MSITTWDRKPKVLVVGDSSAIHTGFANVIKHICMHLYKQKCYHLKTIGWFHSDSEEIVPYEIIPTFRDRGDMMRVERDKYAAETFPHVIKEFQPDLVIAVGDSWMVEPAVFCHDRSTYKLILYIPIDGMPIPKKWTESFAQADITVAYGAFGKRVMLQREPNLLNIEVIPHGVDTDVWVPLSKEDKKTVRKQLGDDDTFWLGCVARNQPRKNLPRLLKTFRLFLNPYVVCNDCGETILQETDQCFCGSKNLYHGEPKKNAKLFLHMALQDCGWNLPELVSRFNLKGDVAYPQGLQIGKGVEVGRLVEIVNAFDVFTLPTGGEGFGLPILEAMACGLPCVVTDYSGHVDFCSGVSELVKVSEFITEPLTNIERAQVDLQDYCMKLDALYYDDIDIFWQKWGSRIEANGNGEEVSKETFKIGVERRNILGLLARKRAEQYKWCDILIKWDELIQRVLGFSPGKVEVEENIEYGTEEL
jgi:glycosyltransferase involved in cell wall biosynthesis